MKKNNGNLYTLLLKAKDNTELKEILESLIGLRQLEVLEKRYIILKMLSEKRSYIEIIKETKTSTATIAKFSNMLNKRNFLKYITN